MKRKIKIVFVDDSPFQRSLMKYYTNGNKAFSLMFTSENGIELLNKLEDCPELPHICLIDLHMPGMNGIETAQKIRKKFPFILLFGYTNSIDGTKLLNIKESGFLSIFGKSDIKTVLEEIQLLINEALNDHPQPH